MIEQAVINDINRELVCTYSVIKNKVEELIDVLAEYQAMNDDEHSVFYFDPPYKPITVTSSFTSYSKEGFDDDEQIRLRDFCNRIAEKKALFVASNSYPASR